MITKLKSYIKKIIDNGFINDTGLIARSKLYYYEGKPYYGYIIYRTCKFFWITRYMYHDAVHDIEILNVEYNGIKIIV